MRAWIQHGLRIVVVATVTIALGFFLVGVSGLLWREVGWFETLAVGSLPFYLPWLGLCAAYTVAYPAAAATPWWPRRAVWTRANLIVVAAAVIAAGSLYLGPLIRLVDGQLHAPASVLGLVAGGLVGPIAEEWVFRGLVWNQVRRADAGTAGVIVAVVTSAVIFGLWHLSFDGVSLAGLRAALGHAEFGVVTGVLRWRLDSIVPGAVIHVVGNTLYLLTVPG